MRHNPALTLSTLALTATFALSACSGDSTVTEDPGAETQAETSDTFNDADVEFATGMIPHHQQALEMSEMALAQGGPEVVDLAEQIEAAQDPEIETMTGWLQDWGVEAPTGMEGMDDMGDMGMMDADDMQEMMGAEGSEFDTVWLEMMIEHHEGAIAMSQVEQTEGANPEAVDLAATIIEAQQAEIIEMEKMLESDQ
ncbi:MAG: DUF305 domain-containing protein [Ornithinimicrobium sp.]